MTVGEANRLRCCLDCGEPGALLWTTTKGENPGRLLRICAVCCHARYWWRFGLVERGPLPEEEATRTPPGTEPPKEGET